MTARARFASDGPFDLEAALLGGQAFTWRPDGRGGFEGPLGRRWTTLRAHRDGIGVDGASPGSVRRYLAIDGPRSVDLSDDEALSALVRRHPGLVVLRQDPWEAMLGFLSSPMNNVPRIAGMLERLGRAAGPPAAGGGRVGWSLPAPAAVARLGSSGLRRLGFGFRAPWIAAAARDVARGELDLAALASGPTRVARETFLALDGAGPKVAECLVAFALGKGDAFPVDRWVHRAAVAIGLDGGADAPAADVMRWGLDRFGERAALAQQLLFHAARQGDVPGVPRSPFRSGLPRGPVLVSTRRTQRL